MIKTSQIIKGWAITTLCPAQDYVIHIFRNVLCLFVAGFSLDCNQGLCFHFPRFTIRNRQDWMFRKIRNSNVNADKVELRYKAVGRQNVARESYLTENITPWYNFFLTFLITQIHLGRFVFYFRHIPLWNTNFQEISFFPGSYVARIPKSTLSEI